MKAGKIVSPYHFAEILVLFALLLACGPIARAHSNKALRAGVILRLDDKFNGSVSALRLGIEIARELYESQHPGVHIDLKSYGHGERLESVLAASRQAIADKIPAVVGAEMSDEALVLADELGAVKTVFITPTASNPQVTENHPFTFRACFSDAQLGTNLGRYIAKNLKPAAVGVVHNVSIPYEDFLSTQILKSYSDNLNPKDLVAHPIFEKKVLRAHLDYSDEIDFFKSHGVTHVVLMTYDNEMGHFVLQAAAKNYFPVYIGSDGWGSNETVLKRMVKDSRSGAQFVGLRNSFWKEDERSRMISAFRKLFYSKQHRQPDAWNAISFDAAWILFTAMDRAKIPNDGESIRQEMTKLQNIELTTTQHFSFGVSNSPEKDLYIYRISASGIQYEATLR